MENLEFEHIAERLRRRAAEVAKACLVSADAAEDVAQDVMLRLWTLRADIENATNAERLAARMARNLAIDALRRQHTVPLDMGRSVADDRLSSPDSDAESSENTAWLEDRLRRLPPAEYQILRMRQTEQMTNADIAAALGIDKASVASLLSRARRKLFNDIKRRMNS